MNKYCPKHPKQKLIQLFSSYACDVCDGKGEGKVKTLLHSGYYIIECNIDDETIRKIRKQFKEALGALGNTVPILKNKGDM